jgi:hypothetical protein
MRNPEFVEVGRIILAVGCKDLDGGADSSHRG